MSNRKKDAAKRRDARHTKDEPRPVATPSSKNTNRWCKGKRGKEHTLKCFVKWKIVSTCYVRACTVCGKEIDSWIDSKFTRMPKPDWVD